ncbi:hypothetical protein QBC35DRAFT_434885 [Podospora australis]|uniref:Uncharacterized protein n=1 Tax=Podospora australis TaxID=1536484 RepID=A0AAN7AHI3_9PEZI|nr:hypothetical protein QBC35DRAFT_434885 [Podospora australis]
MTSTNKCNAWCETSHGWFYGTPKEVPVRGWNNICGRGDTCYVGFSYSGSHGPTTVVTVDSGTSGSQSHTIDTSTTRQSSWGLTATLGINADARLGLPLPKAGADKIVSPVMGGIGITAGLSTKWDMTVSKILGDRFAHTVDKKQSYGVSRSTSDLLGWGLSGGYSKENYATEYCGSWYTIPYVGLSCGRAAIGKFISARRAPNGTLTDSKCQYKQDYLNLCNTYYFKDPLDKPDLYRVRMVFALRDCDAYYILPGEYQLPTFRYSMSAGEDFELDHLQRFGNVNLPGEKIRDDAWVSARQALASKNSFTKLIGVNNWNFKYCGLGNYCVQHKLTPASCYDIPRGYIGDHKSANVVSVSVSPGTCCALFSRHECHGQPLLVKRNVTEDGLKRVGFHGLTHSVICDVEEYCK